jgi:SAM-dependent methyltransferase
MSTSVLKQSVDTELRNSETPELTIPRPPELHDIITDLKQGRRIPDSRFDQIYPESICRVSGNHWTPVDVARRAAELLDRGPETRVLDVGSGAGKFCFVAALTSPGHFTGVEQRPHLVAMTREIADHYAIPRIKFIQAQIEEIDWNDYTGLYLYNPFIENLYPPDERIDDQVLYDQRRYIRLVRVAQLKLATLREGIRIVTYHGFGGEMPPGYTVKLRERQGDDYLVVWEKDR